MSNDTTTNEQQANLTELSDEALDNLISGSAQELSSTQAWE